MLKAAIVGEVWNGAIGTDFAIAGSDWVGAVVSSSAVAAPPHCSVRWQKTLSVRPEPLGIGPR